MVAARWTGMSWPDSISIGALMNTRGLVELIALNIGYDLGILSPRIFTMMVLMAALVTTFMAGPVLALLGRRERRGTLAAEMLPLEVVGGRGTGDGVPLSVSGHQPRAGR